MFTKILSIFSHDMGVDLGTANTLVYIKDKGIIINEPSVVAINNRTDQILAVGEDAKKMVGKTPAHITASKPLVHGIITDFEVAEKMLKHFIQKIHQDSFTLLPRPRVVIGVPLDTTEVERKAVEDAVTQAGGRDVFLIEGPMASAIGARLPVQEPAGTMIIDIGGGTTSIAVISLGGIVTWKLLTTAGDTFNQDIINYARTNFNLLLGESTAEEIKIKIGSAYPAYTEASENRPTYTETPSYVGASEDKPGNRPLTEPRETKMRGRDLISGLPKEVIVNDSQMREALSKSIKTIVEAIRNTLEATPPELIADIYKKGIALSGGGALLRGLDKLISEELQIPVQVVDDPLTAVVRGTGIILEDLDHLRNVLVPSTEEVVEIK